MTGPAPRLRRALVVLASALALWGLIVVVTGGVGFRYGPIFFSSRGPRNSFILAALLAAIAWAAGPAGQRTSAAAADWTWLARQAASLAVRFRRWSATLEVRMAERTPRAAAPLAAALLSVTIIWLGFVEGALVAAGADAWGYASQADLWRDGSLRLPQPLMRELAARIPLDSMAPLAYAASPERMDLVPAVGPGLPMVMAAFALAAGRDAVFYVVPLLAGAAIFATYLIGSRLHDRWSGVGAAVLLAVSPAFLFQLTSSPMSDIPATAWWALSLAAVLKPGRLAAFASGAAAAAAVLTRPNLAPLVTIPGAVVLWRCWQARPLRDSPGPAGSAAHSTGWQPAVLFGAAVVPAALTIALLNNYWYGSPLASGYGDVGSLYSAGNIVPNLERYPRWLVESQTPLILLAAVAPFALWRRRGAAVLLLAWAAAVVASYIAYIPFDAWWFLRFLLPAYPALLALTAAALVAIAVRMPAGTRVAVAVIVLMLVARHGVTYARERATFHTEGEYKYAITGRYVADHLPPRAMFFAMQHSGSVRYYSGRSTLRWDRVPPDQLDWTIAEIQRHGYIPYALVEDWEEEMWRERLTGHAVPPALERPPVTTLPLGNVRIYDLRTRP